MKTSLTTIPVDTPDEPVIDDATRTLEALYREHADFAWRSLRGLGVASEDIEDAVQELFIIAMRKLPSFEGRSTLQTWIFGIAQGVARNRRRQQKRREQHRQAASGAVCLSAETVDAVAAADAVACVEFALQRMSEPLRLVFVLAELQERTAPEIADILQLKLNTVYSRLRLARAAFERVLAEEVGDE